jgi:DNA-binding NarL/FixJ family response regulator
VSAGSHRLSAQGLQNEEVRNRLFSSETTVRHYLTPIFAKIGVLKRLELAVNQKPCDYFKY